MKERKRVTVVFGPTDIRAITSALDILDPWLSDSRFEILPNGSLDFNEDEPVHAVDLLRQTVESATPIEVRDYLGTSSGLGWPVFFGHVVAWWLPQRRRTGLLRAFVNRAALHDVDLRLHWNQGRTVPVVEVVPDNGVMVTGGVISTVIALIASNRFWLDPIFSLLIAASGVVAGRIYQRVVRDRYCGDRLCRSPLTREPTCPSCGGDVKR